MRLNLTSTPGGQGAGAHGGRAGGSHHGAAIADAAGGLRDEPDGDHSHARVV